MMNGNEQQSSLLKCQCSHRIYGIVTYSKTDVEAICYYKDMAWRMVWVLITFLIVFIPDKKQFKGGRVYSSLQFKGIYVIMLGIHGDRNGRPAVLETLYWSSGSRQWAGSGTRPQNPKAHLIDLLPPTRLYLLKVSQPSQRVQPAGKQVVKHMSQCETIHIQTITSVLGPHRLTAILIIQNALNPTSKVLCCVQQAKNCLKT